MENYVETDTKRNHHVTNNRQELSKEILRLLLL